jgi:hypothetical protein
MRRAGMLFAVVIALLASMATFAVVKTSAFRVDGMTDDVAVRHVVAGVKTVRGVQDAVGSASSAILMVRYDNAVTTAVDISEAVANAGFTLSPVEGVGQVGQAPNAKMRAVLLDFQQVLSQTKEFLDKDRYGIVRNLAPAMRLRRDGILGFEKSSGQGNTQQLALTLSRQVDRFAAAAEARDRNAVRADFPEVNKAFKALAEAHSFDDLVAPPVVPADQQAKKSIEQQLEDYVTKVIGGK